MVLKTRINITANRNKCHVPGISSKLKTTYVSDKFQSRKSSIPWKAGKHFTRYLFYLFIYLFAHKTLHKMYCHVQRQQGTDNRGTNSCPLSLNYSNRYKYNAMHLALHRIAIQIAFHPNCYMYVCLSHSVE